ncbi:hypothetical protein [Isobaculum melis]|uniref:Uncharacterized protein n=1 Tax=Isobaculum melis TaxID=142588 RepID=A0A1H9RV83_9LACT|nr:hypothetical protein [Isobaculum melis]SER76801.1 hypothetical protein SAMN04488559_105119 [Isobaculum melis]
MAEKRTADGLTVEDMFQKFFITPDEKSDDKKQMETQEQADEKKDETV